jgi:hypothetical protein
MHMYTEQCDMYAFYFLCEHWYCSHCYVHTTAVYTDKKHVLVASECTRCCVKHECVKNCTAATVAQCLKEIKLHCAEMLLLLLLWCMHCDTH